MTRAELIECLSQNERLSKRAAALVIEAIFDGMSQALRKDERIELRGFGTFEARSYQTFLGRNPRTGDPMEIPARRLAFFRVSREMSDRLNQPQEPGLKLVHKGPGRPKRKSMTVTGVWKAFEDEGIPDADEITRKMG